MHVTCCTVIYLFSYSTITQLFAFAAMPINITTIKAGNIYKQLDMNQTHKIAIFVKETYDIIYII